MKYPEGSLHAAIQEIIDAGGDEILCCRKMAPCDNYENGLCDCEVAPLDGSLTIDEIVRKFEKNFH